MALKEIEEFAENLKHLPSKHVQASHGGGKFVRAGFGDKIDELKKNLKLPGTKSKRQGISEQITKVEAKRARTKDKIDELKKNLKLPGTKSKRQGISEWIAKLEAKL